MTEIIVIVGGFLVIWFLPLRTRRAHVTDAERIREDLENQDEELAVEETEAGVELTGPLAGVPEFQPAGRGAA